MSTYEYKVIPAPTRGKKAKGAKTAEDRFAVALTDVMNEMAADGWAYLRADSLPFEDRAGLMSAKTSQSANLLVFGREVETSAQAAPAEPRAALKEPKIVSGEGPIVLTASNTASDENT